MEHSLIELLTYYVIAGALIIGAPAVFFIVAFMPVTKLTEITVILLSTQTFLEKNNERTSRTY
jgi:hypothetical protein